MKRACLRRPLHPLNVAVPSVQVGPSWLAIRLALLLALGFVLVLAGPARGQPVRTDHLEAELVSEKSALRPGGDNWIALRLDMAEHWHVYWRNPGDSGIPPQITWTLPPGVSVSEFHWPAPRRIPLGPLANYGYEGRLLLPMRVTVGDDVPRDQPLRLNAKVRWLVCQEACVPGSAELTLQLPVTASPVVDSSWADALRASLAAVPRVADGWVASLADQDAREVKMRIAAAPDFALADHQFLFFPEEAGLIEPSARQTASVDGQTLALTLRKASTLQGPVSRLHGVLVATPRDPAGGSPVALLVDTAPAVAPTVSAKGGESGEVPVALRLSLLSAVGLALVGGAMLNLMPCVFPVLAIKVMGFVQTAGMNRRRALHHGLVFAAGIIVTAWLLAGALLLLRAAGAQIGWGFQLQSPAFVLAMAFLFFLLAMVFLGVIDVGVGLVSLAGRVEGGHGLAGSFLSGMLATIVATPCTAPFMGTALGYALLASPVAGLLVFTALGAGMGLPYVLLSASPGLMNRLPRPGPWMDTLKQFMAFPMLATVLWLLWVLGNQRGQDALVIALAGLILAGLGCWIIGRLGGVRGTPARRAFANVVGLVAIVGGFALAVPRGEAITSSSAAVHDPAGLTWEPYSASRLDHLRAQGTPVLVDFTASWCLTCQVNKRVAFSSTEVVEALRRKGVVLLRADWTSYDPAITAALAAFGRTGVPLNVYYSPARGDAPLILPTILTPGSVLDALRDQPGS